MNGDKSLLTRWLQRRRDAAAQAQAEEHQPAIEPPVPAADEAQAVASLPPIETIGPASDVTAFLAPGVPLELTRAALRRAWSADPVIRDFVGLSENAWDFNAAGGVSGFGPLELRDIGELAARVSGDPQPAAPGPAAEAAKAAAVAAAAEPSASIASLQHENAEGKPREPRPRRRHGAAVPQ